MKYVYSKVNDLNISQPLAVSIGNFDGLHIGHQNLLQNLVAISKNKKFLSCLVSFNPHPISYFKKDKNFLIDLEQTKIELLEKIGLDFYVSIIFDKTIANLTSNEFEDIVLSKGLNTKLILSGLDFKYGSGRSGNITTLKNFSDKNFFLFKECSETKRITSPKFTNETRNPFNRKNKYFVTILKFDNKNNMNCIKKLK